MLSPTTADALEVSATVLRRQTTRMNAFSGGFESLLGRQTTLNAAYVSQWIEFANEDERADQSHPAEPRSCCWADTRTAATANCAIVSASASRSAPTTRSSAPSSPTAPRPSTCRARWPCRSSRSSPSTKASFGYGHAWLAAGDGFSDNGPAFDVGLEWTGRHSGATVRYGRTFLPSFGFGGTFQNEELRASIRTALSRSLQWSGNFTISDNDPLEPGDPSLRSISARTALGWVIKRRLRFDAYVQHVSQDSGLAGGHVLRTRAGVQATVSQTVRATQ